DIQHQITLLLVLLISSKGAAGVTGSGFIVMAATLSAVGHIPVAGLALILGIDRFMSEARALTNLVGNSLATIVVAKWVGALDKDKLNDALNVPYWHHLRQLHDSHVHRYETSPMCSCE
ncbi:cation:dicarboxylase symporter family transporter, partial [Acinetobacter baumannii]